MSLIKCPECAKEFSDHASKCPNCAWPVSWEYIINLKEKTALERILEKYRSMQQNGTTFTKFNIYREEIFSEIELELIYRQGIKETLKKEYWLFESLTLYPEPYVYNNREYYYSMFIFDDKYKKLLKKSSASNEYLGNVNKIPEACLKGLKYSLYIILSNIKKMGIEEFYVYLREIAKLYIEHIPGIDDIDELADLFFCITNNYLFYAENNNVIFNKEIDEIIYDKKFNDIFVRGCYSTNLALMVMFQNKTVDLKEFHKFAIKQDSNYSEITNATCQLEAMGCLTNSKLDKVITSTLNENRCTEILSKISNHIDNELKTKTTTDNHTLYLSYINNEYVDFTTFNGMLIYVIDKNEQLEYILDTTKNKFEIEKVNEATKYKKYKQGIIECLKERPIISIENLNIFNTDIASLKEDELLDIINKMVNEKIIDIYDSEVEKESRIISKHNQYKSYSDIPNKLERDKYVYLKEIEKVLYRLKGATVLELKSNSRLLIDYTEKYDLLDLLNYLVQCDELRKYDYYPGLFFMKSTHVEDPRLSETSEAYILKGLADKSKQYLEAFNNDSKLESLFNGLVQAYNELASAIISQPQVPYRPMSTAAVGIAGTAFGGMTAGLIALQMQAKKQEQYNMNYENYVLEKDKIELLRERAHNYLYWIEEYIRTNKEINIDWEQTKTEIYSRTSN